jgi:phytol kinase
MNLNIVGIIVSYVYIFLIILGAKLFEKLGKEASRKFIHIMLGNWWIILLIFFDNVFFAAFVPATFVIINYISYKKDLIKVMEREEDKKDGLGTVYYAISLLIISIVTFLKIDKIDPILGLVPIFVMSYGDGLAAILGKAIKSPKYKVGNTQKSIAGSLTMLIVSLLIISIYYVINPVTYWIVKAIIMSIVVTIIEAVSIKGTDNITVPIAVFLMMILSSNILI